jgi:hypothetical protein
LIAISSAFTVIPVPAPMFNVASPLVAVPVKPSPALTPVISPTLPVIVSVPAESSYDNPIPAPAVSKVFATWSSMTSIAAVPNAPATKSPELSRTSFVPTDRPFFSIKFFSPDQLLVKRVDLK